MQTINNDDRSSDAQELQLNKQNKSAAPLPRKPSTIVKKSSQNLYDASPGDDVKRINSVNLTASKHKRDELGMSSEHATTSYNAPEEPVVNPESAFKQVIQNLKGDDWQKIFDGLNTAKRLCTFHKDIVQANGGCKELIKSVVRHCDNLRS